MIIIFSACNCKSKGTTFCSKLDGHCECSIGYSGAKCEKCQNGYYISSQANGEIICTGECLIFHNHNDILE